MQKPVDLPALEARVASVRRFNRFYTRLMGMLGDRILRSAFTLTEGRVLFELATQSLPTAAEVARELDLDPGYLSRILNRFERDGLLARLPAADRRRSLLQLTEAGQATFRPIDAGARAQIGHIIGGLADTAQAELIQALNVIERRLGGDESLAPATLRAHRPGDLGWVISRHGALYAQEYGFDASFEAFVAKVASGFLEAHDPARERCWMAETDGVPAGSVMLVRETDEVAKLRLLIVEPSARGRGVGRDLVRTCVDFAREAGYRRVTLWTHDILHAARYIYHEIGFRKIGATPQRSFGLDLVAEDWELALV